MKKRALCLLVTGFEEIETIAPIDLLRRAETEVVIASLGKEKLVTGRCGMTIEADVILGDVFEQSFDLLLLPGGPGVKALRTDGRPAKLAKSYADAGKIVAAICAAPTVLADAGLLTGKRFTAHFSVHSELPGVLAEERVVKDGNIITSRGAGTAIEFGLALVSELFGSPKAEEVAKAIML
jgi:4-methyl-5(b-hydroxyethyl)-thiazole monophosphate biosynthesis